MFHTAFLSFLLIFLVLSYLVFAVAPVPVTRTQNLNDQVSSSSPTVLAQVAELDMTEGDELLESSVDEDEFIKGRMNLEMNDYGGTGANRDHEPRTPGRA